MQVLTLSVLLHVEFMATRMRVSGFITTRTAANGSFVAGLPHVNNHGNTPDLKMCYDEKSYTCHTQVTSTHAVMLHHICTRTLAVYGL